MLENCETKRERPRLGEDIEYYQSRKFYNFVPSNNTFLQEAKVAALTLSKTTNFPIGIVAVKDGVVVARAANGNGYHEINLNSEGHKRGCIRRYLSEQRELNGGEKLKSGEGFELCPGCSVSSHAEANLITSTTNKEILVDAEVYMYGHYWCCEACWRKMLSVGISKVNLCQDIDFSDKDNVRKFAEELSRFRS